LQDIEQWNQQTLGIAVSCRQRRIGEGEQQRQRHRDQHAQGRARRIFRQIRRIERGRRALQVDERLKQVTTCFTQKYQEADNQQDSEHVPAAEQTIPAADRYRYKNAHSLWPWLSQNRRGRCSRRSSRSHEPLRSHIIAAAVFKPFYERI